MTTNSSHLRKQRHRVVEAYRLDRYDNSSPLVIASAKRVVEAYRLDRYDNLKQKQGLHALQCMETLFHK